MLKNNECKLNLRTKRLADLVDINAPSYLICSELSMVIKAAIDCYPEEMVNLGIDQVDEFVVCESS
jgi:hypothetical protein